MAIQHRSTLRELYALTHTKFATERAKGIIFEDKYPADSIFHVVSQLKNMETMAAAGAIITYRIPYLIASGALGAKMKDSALVMALMQRMSPTEFVTNVKMLEKLGATTDPILKATFDECVEKAKGKATKNTLKTTKAVESVKDEGLKAKLKVVQDAQIAQIGIEGNWLVLADKSGSMAQAIEIARVVAGTLAKFVTGKVHLVFFDSLPRHMDVTGKSMDQINDMTRNIRANGQTSIGCGVQWAIENKVEVDGIAVITDGGDNSLPYFPEAYKKYVSWSQKEVPVYVYHCDGQVSQMLMMCKMEHVDVQVFQMPSSVDYYALPNLIQSMRTNRYSLVQEIMDTPLLTYNPREVGEIEEVEELETVPA